MLQPIVWVVVRDALRVAMQPWVKARERAGFAVHFVDPDNARLSTAPPSHVLVVGHPLGTGAFEMRTARHPPAYRHMKTAFHGDHALVHGDLETPPRHAVGRWPVRTHDELAVLVRRAVGGARTPPSIVRFVDGDPKWITPVNLACHWLATRAARQPLRDGIAATRASFNPCAPPAHTTDVATWVAEGGRVFAYVGHGQPDHVDGLSTATLPPDGGRVGVVVLACCHAGAFDTEARGLALDWLLREHGPAAVLAASNVTDPRLNGPLARAFVDGALRPGATVGDALMAARATLQGAPTDVLLAGLRAFALPSLRRAHQGLYNLLGDPTAVL